MLPICNGSGVRFRAATYNVHFFQRGWSATQHTLKSLDADVIALQEVLVSGGSPLHSIARNMGYRYVVSQPYVRYGNSYWVLAFLSRYPLLSQSEVRLGQSRRALRVILDVQGQPVEFITMHLTPLAGNSSGRDDVIRRSESRKRELSDLFAWLGPPAGPRILLGDFNFLRGPVGFWMDEYEMLDDAGYEDADGGLFPDNEDTFPIPGETRTALESTIPGWLIPHAITLDYMFVTAVDVESVQVREADGSDHWPLVGDFRIEGSQ